MSKNKYNNEKSPAVIIAVVSVIVLGIGLLLYKTSPQNATQANQNDQTNTGYGDHHDRSNFSVNSDALNGLVDKPMPDIELFDKDGNSFKVSNLKGKNVVLFFNEGLMCYPACWNQISSFGNDQRFNNDKTQAISVVTDSPKNWQTAIDKMPELAKSMTMFDKGASVSGQLGMLTTASSMHKGSLPGHTYVLIDKNGIVRFVFDDPNMAIANDVLAKKIDELNK